MNVLVTGSSQGIGRAAAERYLDLGHRVFGMDIKPAAIEHPAYTHFQADVRDAARLPEIPGLHILFLNAGAQNGEDDISTNLTGAINATPKRKTR